MSDDVRGEPAAGAMATLCVSYDRKEGNTHSAAQYEISRDTSSQNSF